MVYIDELLFAFVFRSSCLIPEHDVVVPPSWNISNVELHIGMLIVPPFGLRRFRWI